MGFCKFLHHQCDSPAPETPLKARYSKNILIIKFKQLKLNFFHFAGSFKKFDDSCSTGLRFLIILLFVLLDNWVVWNPLLTFKSLFLSCFLWAVSHLFFFFSFLINFEKFWKRKWSTATGAQWILPSTPHFDVIRLWRMQSLNWDTNLVCYFHGEKVILR